jgi:NAD+ synthase
MNQTPKQQITHIVKWLKAYARSAKIDKFVVGVSGGIDSAVVSTLCAKTGLDTFVVTLPIRQNKKLHQLSTDQCAWLVSKFPENVVHINIDLTSVFSAFEKKFDREFVNPVDNSSVQLAFANSRSRLRMMALYQLAQSQGALVVGTGNRVEDFGVGFFTKYGDGGVDISPIGDCLKTEVWAMATELGIQDSIIAAPPTDGLWDDGRTDEDQLGMPYPALEEAMMLDETSNQPLTQVSADNLKRYRAIRARNLHKMNSIPVCQMPRL